MNGLTTPSIKNAKCAYCSSNGRCDCWVNFKKEKCQRHMRLFLGNTSSSQAHETPCITHEQFSGIIMLTGRIRISTSTHRLIVASGCMQYAMSARAVLDAMVLVENLAFPEGRHKVH